MTGDELVMEWTIRGAPHVYQRASLRALEVAVEPFSDADAGTRICDASKPLKAAGIGNLEALDSVAEAMRSVVTTPMVKGEVSTRMTALMGPPYLRSCRPCNTTHLYECRSGWPHFEPAWSWRPTPLPRFCSPFAASHEPLRSRRGMT
jgi:hypothetical protein